MDKKYKIIKIHKRDGYYGQRKEIAGKIGIFAEHDMSDIDTFPKGFVNGTFYPDDETDGHYYFYAVKLEEVNA